MHSHPDLVDSAYWNGAVLAVALRMTSPATMPRTPSILLESCHPSQFDGLHHFSRHLTLRKVVAQCVQQVQILGTFQQKVEMIVGHL